MFSACENEGEMETEACLTAFLLTKIGDYKKFGTINSYDFVFDYLNERRRNQKAVSR